MYRYATSVLLTLMLFTIGTAKLTAAPRLVIPEKSFDFGISPQNAKLSHVFWLKAEGSDSLKILKVAPACGCTKAPLESNHLAGGDSTRLEIIFSTGKRAGKMVKSARIKTNSGDSDQQVRFSAKVVTRPDSTYPIIIAPYKLTLGQFTDRRRQNFSFAIQNVSSDEIPIHLIAYPSDLFSVVLPATIAQQSSTECSLVFSEAGMAGSFEKSFTIELGDSEKTRFTVPVKHQANPAASPVTAVDTPK